MKLLSVNVATEQTILIGSREVKTGIYKMPADGPVFVHHEGLTGDTISNLKDHGGPDQAVYVYSTADYQWWAALLGQTLRPGTFGENLTITDLDTSHIMIGDRLQVGSVVLEVTAPRIPCSTFAQRMGDPGWVKRFREAERPGLYCRVIVPGEVCAGDPVRYLPHNGESVSVVEIFRLYYESKPSEERLRRALNTPIDIRARQDYEERLRQLT